MKRLEAEMLEVANIFQFERTAQLRYEIYEFRK